MNSELSDKLEIILRSAIDRLYQKEETMGLDLEDFRVLEILYKISKDTLDNTSNSPLSTPNLPYNLIDLLRAAKGSPDDNSNI